MIGLLHALSMLVHQISIFFFPAAVVAIASHPYWSGARDKRKAVLVYTLAASLPVVTAYCWVWFGFLDREWSSREFLTWITLNGTGTFAFRSASLNALQSLRSSVRVFFGGRISLALAFVEKPLLPILVALMLVAFGWFAMGLGKVLRQPRGPIRETEFIESGRLDPRKFLITWAGVFFVFLFFWLTEYPYYRLYYLPALILLLGTLLKRRQGPVARHRSMRPLAAFVVFMMTFNFTFLIYPYAQVEATPPIKLAADAKAVWKDNVLVLYKDFTCDNWMMRYFNPHTTWRQVDFVDRGDLARQVREAFQHGRIVWVDTTVLGHLASSADVREWLQNHATLSNTWGISNQKHHIQFAQLLPH